jgi:hypothetical protein
MKAATGGRIGDAPIEPEFMDAMNTLAALVDVTLNGDAKGDARKNGFVLVVFPFGGDPGQRANYISNASRDDVVTLLKEQLARFEGQPEVKGRA